MKCGPVCDKHAKYQKQAPPTPKSSMYNPKRRTSHPRTRMSELKHMPVVSTFQFVITAIFMYSKIKIVIQKRRMFQLLFLSLFGGVWCVNIYKSFASFCKFYILALALEFVITLISTFLIVPSVLKSFLLPGNGFSYW